MGLREKDIVVAGAVLILFLNTVSGFAQSRNHEKEAWIDSLLQTMSLREKIGQMLMLPVYSNKSRQYYDDVEYLVKNFHLGGLIFFQGSPTRQALLTNRFQEAAKIRLFIAMDAEWGLAMRLDSLDVFPKNMTLGAVQDNRLIYNLGAEYARQCKIMGVHMNFAPVLDVNNNPENPVINIRSFGENPQVVTEKGIAIIDGMQDNGIIAVGKHFPGHGDTGTDSHHSLPVISHDRIRLDSVELLPFRNAIQAGVKGLMVGHLSVPDIEAQTGLPGSLSEKMIKDLLVEEMGFRNLIITDAMNMAGVTSKFPEGERELRAFIAGNHLITMPVNIPAVFTSFEKALLEKRISEPEITDRVRKILSLKFDSGLMDEPEINTGQLTERLNSRSEDVNSRIFEHAVTLLKDDNHLVPFHILDTTQFATLTLYEDADRDYIRKIKRYTLSDQYTYQKNELSDNDYKHLLDVLSGYDVVVASLHNLSNNPKRKFGLYQKDIEFLHELNEKTNVVLVVFGNPYSLQYFDKMNTLICAYEDNQYAGTAVAQQLFGAIPFLGKLPVSVTSTLVEGTGIHIPALGRLGYSTPTREGFDPGKLAIVDSIVEDAIQQEMIPGGQILIARNGRIVKEKCYGHLSYEHQIAVSDTTLYDLASVTKVGGTLQMLMMLADNGFIDLDKKMSFYLKELKNTNKEDLTIRDILTHQAGLIPYYPYWYYTTNEKNGDYKYYSHQNSSEYTVEVTQDLYARKDLQDSVWTWIIKSELLEKKDPFKSYEYVYSDIGFYLIQKLLQQLTGMPLNEFLHTYLIEPLGIRQIGFLPRNNFPLEQIAPSAVDHVFRKGIIHGNVHDEIASMYGGVAGHAGLFSNAYSLAVILQMNLQNGYYGGIQYIQPETLNEFTKRQYRYNRRGLGWDKPQVLGHEYNPASYLASPESYGHSGFTGTYVWVDPAFNLIYIFLSNRTYPDAGNKKLIDLEVRKRIQTVIYSSILNYSL